MASTRRLAAILAADVAGYSRLMGADEEGTHERLKAHLVELVDPKIGEHHGRIVKNTGDGVLAEFASVVDALRCAAEMQAGMTERNASAPADQCIKFRIGIHQGDVVVEDYDIFGDAVNIAARLEGLAEPGGICVSARVRGDAAGKLDLSFEDMGRQLLKNIGRPIRVYALRPKTVANLPVSSVLPEAPPRRPGALAATAAAIAAALVIGLVGWWLWPATRSTQTPAVTAVAAAPTAIPQPPGAPRLSIVVLPFVNLNNDPEQQYFVDAVTDDLTTDLSRIGQSFVISRNTAFTYRNKPVDTKQIGRELGVRYLLEGSIRRSANKVRVNAQLIDAETDAHLWAQQFDGDVSDLFALQNDITSRIAVALNLALVGAEAARRPANPDALDYILLGRAALDRPPTRDSFAEAIGLFERALALDPRSVEAQSRLASALSARVMIGIADPATADIARAEVLVGQALATAPGSPLAHYAKGEVLRVQNRCDEAIFEFETVLAFDRNAIGALFQLGWCKLMTGSMAEVIPLAEQGIRLSPRDPLIGSFYQRIGLVHLLQSRTDEAIVWLEKARSTNAGLSFLHAFLASAYALKGETDRAAAELAEARRLMGEGSYTSIARIRTRLEGVPTVRSLYETTYLAGLRKAGVPEE